MLSPQRKNFWILLTFLAIAFTAFRLVNANNGPFTATHVNFESFDSEFRKTTCKKKHERKHPTFAREQMHKRKDRRRKRCKSSTHGY